MSCIMNTHHVMSCALVGVSDETIPEGICYNSREPYAKRTESDVIDDRVPYTKRCERSGRVPYTKRCERSINVVCLIQRGVSDGEHRLPDGELLYVTSDDSNSS